MKLKNKPEVYRGTGKLLSSMLIYYILGPVIVGLILFVLFVIKYLI